MSSGVHIFGIRHHGPGSARSLLGALDALKPDALLIEGPPDADDLIPLVASEEMRPPVALLIYAASNPQHSAFFPFSEFSPEWQAIKYALKHSVPVRFIDLAQQYQLAMRNMCEIGKLGKGEKKDTEFVDDAAASRVYEDPLNALAQAAGFSDGERWWEFLIEERTSDHDIFSGITEAMTVLREEQEYLFPSEDDVRNELREAAMRKNINAARKEGFERIAVVCGAWHVPALQKADSVNDDNARLKNLPKIKVSTTWVPWTYDRLSYMSGYGAGIYSPGWYEHLWMSWKRDTPPEQDIGAVWLTRVARLLRDEDLDVSTANIIEASRLSEALSTMRGRPLPGLDEMNDAACAVLCDGEDISLKLIQRKLIIGERMGSVPTDTPTVPLQKDIESLQKSLRIKPKSAITPLDIDLRMAMGLNRSHFLHRLRLLDIPWGTPEDRLNRDKGTFHERWTLKWEPRFAVDIIDASVWGSTVQDAAEARLNDMAARIENLQACAQLTETALFANLQNSVVRLMQRLDSLAAVGSDAIQMMESLPSLVRILRYGDVRKTEIELVKQIVHSLLTRIFLGFPAACSGIDDEAAQNVFKCMDNTDTVTKLLQNVQHSQAWQGTLYKVLVLPEVHPLIAGRACRILLDAGNLSEENTARNLSLALSRAAKPQDAVAWVEGLISGSGAILLYHENLLEILDNWICTLSDERFVEMVPLLRRAFVNFSKAERRQLGEALRRGQQQEATSSNIPLRLHMESAEVALAYSLLLLDVKIAEGDS